MERQADLFSLKPPAQQVAPNTSRSQRFYSQSYQHCPQCIALLYGRNRQYPFADGKLIFLSGSPELERVGDIPTGRLSGIVNHHVPKYLRSNQMPSYETNCIEDWETKLNKIVDETIKQDMTLISGIPPWMQMYFDELIKRSGKKLANCFLTSV